MSKYIGLIPCAGRGSRMGILTDKVPKAMLPYKNKPIIYHQIKALYDIGVRDIILVVGYKKEIIIDYINREFKNINIKYVIQNELDGLGRAISIAAKYVNDNDNLIITLGDAIYNNIELIPNSISYIEVKDPHRWCMIEVDSNGEIKKFIDKPQYNIKTKRAVNGIYIINNVEQFKSSIKYMLMNNIKIKNEFQISTILDDYNKYIKLKAIKHEDWIDLGLICNFVDANKNSCRYFNSIEINGEEVTKKSSNISKIRDEINWYNNVIPTKIDNYTPRLIRYPRSMTEYTMSLIEGKTLCETFLYNHVTDNEISKIFDLISNYLYDTKINSSYIPENVDLLTKSILIDKTEKRIKDFPKEFFENKEIKINKITYKNPLYYLHSIYNYIEEISKDSFKYWSILHGDFFFGNIMYNGKEIKVIDPRGEYGEKGIAGDIRYDIAKLNHSINGLYDFIVNDLFIINDNIAELEYMIYENSNVKQISEIFNRKILSIYNKQEITVITGLLFLSMIPLHSDSYNRQKMFFIRATELLNDII